APAHAGAADGRTDGPAPVRSAGVGVDVPQGLPVLDCRADCAASPLVGGASGVVRHLGHQAGGASMTDRPTRDQFAEFARLAEQATAGPWELDSGDDAVWHTEYEQHYQVARLNGLTHRRHQNGLFIAAARTAVPLLLDAYAALETENARLRAEAVDPE